MNRSLQIHGVRARIPTISAYQILTVAFGVFLTDFQVIIDTRIVGLNVHVTKSQAETLEDDKYRHTCRPMYDMYSLSEQSNVCYTTNPSKRDDIADVHVVVIRVATNVGCTNREI